jgi:hypothetical protein
MNKRVFRTISYICICAFMTTGLCGCALVPSLNLTEEQSTLIAEYAAGKLIEYAKGHPGGLMTTVEDIDLTEVNPGLKKEEEPLPEPGLPGQVMPLQNAPELPEENGPAGAGAAASKDERVAGASGLA